MPFYLVGDAKSMVWSKWSAMLLVQRDVNTLYLISLMKFFKKLNSISNIFQEPHDFLIFTGSVTIYISLRSSQCKVPRKKSQTNIFLIRGTSILKITEVGFSILIKHFWGPFFACFYFREGISFYFFYRTSFLSFPYISFLSFLFYFSFFREFNCVYCVYLPEIQNVLWNIPTLT